MNDVLVPGPLRSLERMAGISQEVSPNDVLALLARNVYTQGYQQGKPTEFLLLVDRYMEQARELQALAGPGNQIKVASCDDAAPLIRILGYRMRQGCGQKGFALETANPTRAFLTIDSGFPLVDLEESLQAGTPFVYAYAPSRVSALFHESDWAQLRSGQKRVSGDLVSVLLSDPLVARLYWAMSKEDDETRDYLSHSPGLHALLPYADVLDFYGGEISIHAGHVAIPGGLMAPTEWRDLVGASPDSPKQFVTNLLSRDKGWMAAYFDTISRVSFSQQKHLADSSRLKHLYDAYRNVDPEESATRGVFRRNSDLLVLFTRLEWEPNNQIHVPGGLDVWKQIMREKTSVKEFRDLGKRAQRWDRSEQLLEGLVTLSRISTDIGPLQMYLVATEIDRERPADHPLSADTIRVLADRYAQFNTWYQVFTEFPELDDASITRFVTVADTVDKLPNRILRANADGSFQAAVCLWQILVRQGQIPEKDINSSWANLLDSFKSVSSPVQLFDAARGSLQALITAAGAPANASQAEIIDLLAGPHEDNPEAQRVHQQLAGRIASVLEDQRLVSLDTLFALNDGLKDMADHGGKGDNLLSLANELREFDLPQPIFTNSEKISWAPAIYTDHHAELQIKTDLTKVIKGPSSPQQLTAARGQLAPFLRDTLVGLNYAYYEPPDAQMLHHNPLFVRSHDFLGVSILGSDRLWGAPRVLGVGTPAGGGAYLMGSLSDLPYALATTEEDFIAPRNIQALIWKELVPVLMVSATVPRWWNVTPDELHAVTLYQRSGEELLTAAAKDADLREKVLDILSDCMPPQRLEDLESALPQATDVSQILPTVEPAETAYLAAEFRHDHKDAADNWGSASQQLDDLLHRSPEQTSWARVSRDFGVPHPTLAQTNARELLNVKPFPFFASYSSRLFGESWESGNLYWARLADEKGYSPAALNMLVPALTQRMISNIFATDIEDWPAVLRAMRETGDEFRQGKIASLPPAASSLHASEPTISGVTVQ